LGPRRLSNRTAGASGLTPEEHAKCSERSEHRLFDALHIQRELFPRSVMSGDLDDLGALHGLTFGVPFPLLVEGRWGFPNGPDERAAVGDGENPERA
jgi:hypothetical protein